MVLEGSNNLYAISQGYSKCVQEILNLNEKTHSDHNFKLIPHRWHIVTLVPIFIAFDQFQHPHHLQTQNRIQIQFLGLINRQFCLNK